MKDDVFNILIFFVLFMFGIWLTASGQNIITKGKVNNHCSEPLTWNIGTIDSRFSINAETVTKLVSEVNELWSDTVGNNLFIQSDSAEIKINFIYSDQQEFTDNEQVLSHKINRMKLDYYAMKIDYQQWSNHYNKLLRVYNKIILEYDETVKQYKRTLSRLDDTGVIPREENEKLNNLKKKINQYEQTSEEQLNELNALAKKMEKLSNKLNDHADKVNELIFYYREYFTQMKTFHQGAYVQAGDRKKINIYQFGSINKLRLVLAHEVGHALGLSHVYNPESVMYFLMENQKVRNLQLSNEDIEAIKDRCLN